MTQAQSRWVQAAWRVLPLVALQALLLGLLAHYTWAGTSHWHTTDLKVYFDAARALLGGRLPYRDFALEYPPLALVPFTLPLLAAGGLAAEFPAYVRWFYVQNLLLSSLIALGIARVLAPSRSEWRGPALVLYAVLVALVAPLLPWRYDLFPAFLTLLALYCSQRGRPGLAGWWLGCGVVAKLYPLVLLPVFALYYVLGGRWRAVVRLALGSAAAVLVALLPFVLLAPDDTFVFLRYHQQRGLQIESLPAGVMLLGHQLGWLDVAIAYNYGALHLVAPPADAAVAWLPLTFIAVLGAVLARSAVWFQRERAATGEIHASTLAHGCVAALLAFIATNKVLSPQYLIWLLPFAPLLPVRYAGVQALIFGLTTLLFPFTYQSLLDLHSLPVLLLNLRNALIVVLLLWLLSCRPAAPGRVPSRIYGPASPVGTGAAPPSSRRL